MSQQIFINLPVENLPRAVEFFSKLGYTFNAQFTNEDATCMIIGENIFAMLLVRKYFQTFTKKTLVDAKISTEAILALSAASRADVDRLADLAVAAGGREIRDPQDHGFMYARAYEDLDGHIWEHFWMDPSHIQG